MNTRKRFFTILGLLLALPAVALAATYDYVDTQGQVASVEAQSPDQAIALAPSRAPTSGVALQSGIMAGQLANVDSGAYQYVDTAGEVRTVDAATPEQALATAPAKAPTSGVIATAVVALPSSTEVPVSSY